VTVMGMLFDGGLVAILIRIINEYECTVIQELVYTVRCCIGSGRCFAFTHQMAALFYAK